MKRKPGRPKQKQPRSIIKCFRLTKEEAKEVNKAIKHGLNLSKICRDAVHKKAQRVEAAVK